MPFGLHKIPADRTLQYCVDYNNWLSRASAAGFIVFSFYHHNSLIGNYEHEEEKARVDAREGRDRARSRQEAPQAQQGNLALFDHADR